MTRINRAITLAVTTVVATGITLAPTASADTSASDFLQALNTAGIGYTDPNATAALGQTVCPMLVEPGKSFASVASTVANNGISPDMASFFTGIAISMYCPSMMTALGNGTFLNFLQTTPGLPRPPGL